MLTHTSQTWRHERCVSVPVCATGPVSGLLSAMPSAPFAGVALGGDIRRFDALYAGKQSHNPVGVTSS